MEIEYKSKRSEMVPFKDVSPGEPFMSGDVLLLKLKQKLPNRGNAAYFHDGTIVNFGPGDLVYGVEYQLTVTSL